MTGKANHGNPITIKEAVEAVLLKSGEPMTIKEITDAIIAGNLYPFNTASPSNMVQKAIRRTTKDVNHSQCTAGPKLFVKTADKKYALNR
mgnify:FL=1